MDGSQAKKLAPPLGFGCEFICVVKVHVFWVLGVGTKVTTIIIIIE